jgi:hypothetical protein
MAIAAAFDLSRPRILGPHWLLPEIQPVLRRHRRTAPQAGVLPLVTGGCGGIRIAERRADNRPCSAATQLRQALRR